MRSAPPTLPGTPISPSMPPRSCFAQKVTMPPRSADASTNAALPSMRTPGCAEGRCSTTHGSSPSAMRTFVPPPRKRYGIWFSASKRITSGIVSYLRNRSWSVVPPIPSDVFSVSDTPGRNSTSSSFSRAAGELSLIRMNRRHPCTEKKRELLQNASDAARSDCQHCVARPRLAQHVFHACLHGAREHDVLVAGRADRFGEPLSRDALNGSFARWIDFAQYQHVALIERTAKILPQMLGSRVAVRLEQHQQPLVAASSRGFERGANLGRMMAVIVDKSYAGERAFDFETAPDTRKLPQAGANQVRGNVEGKTDGSRGGRVSHVVNPRRRRQMEDAEVFAVIGQAKLAREAFEFDVADHEVGLARSAVGDDGPLHARQNRLHVGLIHTENHGAIEGHAVHELEKDVLDFLERRVLIQMLTVDCSDHGDHRGQQQERAIALVRFDHHVLALANSGVRTHVTHSSPDDERRIKVSRGKYGGDHRSGCRLAMRACDCDAVFQPHQFGQHLGARNHGDFQPIRLNHLNVVGPHSGRDHHDVRAVHVFRLMAFSNRGAEIPQPLRDGRNLQVGAGNGVARGKQNFGDAAHAAAANSDEMDALEIAECDVHCQPSFGVATFSSRSTISSTARGRASARARFSISASLRGWSRREKISVVSRSGVSSSWGSSRAAPAFCMASALRV